MRPGIFKFTGRIPGDFFCRSRLFRFHDQLLYIDLPSFRTPPPLTMLGRRPLGLELVLDILLEFVEVLAGEFLAGEFLAGEFLAGEFLAGIAILGMVKLGVAGTMEGGLF